jgi:HEAT repeat protein
MNSMTSQNVIAGVAGTALVLLCSSGAWAQGPTLPPAAMPREEAAALAQSWVLLAEGKYDEASQHARGVLSRFPRSVAALAVLIETDIARAGATSALDSYERWIGTHQFEEPAALRRVARAFLYEWSRQTKDLLAQNDALAALAQDGDEQASAVLVALPTAAGVRARHGDPKAFAGLISRFNAASGSKVNEIQLLAETGSPRAVAPIRPLLTDPLPDNRAAAAAALGRLEDRASIPRLKALLQDPGGNVRVAAAGALYTMGDMSGAAILDELATSEHESIRRSAALLMASQPSETWKTLVRGLGSAEDPAIRLDAARLMAPHDPEFSRQLFEQLASHENVAIREQAAVTMAELPSAGFAELRRVLRMPVGQAQVRAAAKILQATR